METTRQRKNQSEKQVERENDKLLVLPRVHNAQLYCMQLNHRFRIFFTNSIFASFCRWIFDSCNQQFIYSLTVATYVYV